MRVAVVSTFDTGHIKKKLKEHGFIIDNKSPNIVISYGGDGTILYSERKYPGIPKIAIKTTKICRKCDHTSKQIDHILRKLTSKKYNIKKEMKIIGYYKKRKLHSLNDIQIRNKLPVKALRFSIEINGKNYGEIIGDGVIISTPFGSSGYFKSAGGKSFNKGIGVCLNNPFIKNRPFKKFSVFAENSTIKIKILREKAVIGHDNDTKIYELKLGDIITVKKSKEYAKFIVTQDSN